MKTIIVALQVVLVLTSSLTTAQDVCDINDVTRKEVKESCHEECKCEVDSKKSTVNVYCSGQDLTSVPSDLHACTTELDMSDCSIPHLMDDAFSSVNLKHVKYLTMKNCNISTINVEAFKPLLSLTHLDLYGNNIINITTENVPENFEELDLERNPLDCNTVKEAFHKVLPNLTVICNGTGISRMPKDIGRKCGIDSECIELARCQDNECVCKVGYMSSADSSTCLPVPGLGEKCDTECQANHTTCQDNICACEPMFVPHSTELECLPVAAELNGSCVEDIQCSKGLGDSAICTGGYCACKLGLTPRSDLKGCTPGGIERNLPTSEPTTTTPSTTPPEIINTRAATEDGHKVGNDHKAHNDDGTDNDLGTDNQTVSGGSAWIIGVVIGVIVIGGLVVWKRRWIIEKFSRH